MTINETEIRVLTVKLTPDEIVARGRRAAEAHKEKLKVEAEAKTAADSAKKRVKGLEFEIDALADAVFTRAEPQDVVCRWQRNDENGTMELFREDTYDRVDVRSMRHDEKQTSLFAVTGGKYEPPPDETDADEGDIVPRQYTPSSPAAAASQAREAKRRKKAAVAP